MFLSQVARVIQRVGNDGVVDEDEEGQVCEEVKQVEGAKATEFTPDLFLLLLTDPPCLQLHKQLFSTDTTLWCLAALRLALQQEQEQLLQNKHTMYASHDAFYCRFRFRELPSVVFIVHRVVHKPSQFSNLIGPKVLINSL